MSLSHAPHNECRIAELITAARLGSTTSLGQLLANYRGYLLLVANQEVGGDLRAKVAPSDVAQETFLIAHQKFEAFEGTSELEFRAWLRRILVNRYKDLWRHYKATQKRDTERELQLAGDDQLAERAAHVADLHDSPSEQAVASEELIALQEALGRLPAEQRAVIEMRNWERMTYLDIGERLGKSEEAIRKIWVRGMKRLIDSWHTDR